MTDTQRLKITNEIIQYSLINLQLCEMIWQYVSYIQRRTYMTMTTLMILRTLDVLATRRANALWLGNTFFLRPGLGANSGWLLLNVAASGYALWGTDVCLSQGWGQRYVSNPRRMVERARERLVSYATLTVTRDGTSSTSLPDPSDRSREAQRCRGAAS